MKVYSGIEKLPAFKNAVVTIGTFDGVHLAHRKLISKINELALENEGESVIVTFDPHPRKILNPGDPRLKILTTLDEKISLLEKSGVHNLVITEFSTAFSQMLPEEYITDFLVKYFHPRIVVIGYNHRFGRNRSGDVELLRKLSASFHYEVELITKQTIEEVDISSTLIREALMRGDIKSANQMLGHPYRFSGKVVEGDKRGNMIGFPTANIELNEDDKILPMDGVYAVRAWMNESDIHSGMMNIGFRPTMDGLNHKIEVHLFNFNHNIYGEILSVEPVVLLRREQKFNSLEELIQQLKRDKAAALNALI